MRKSPDRARAAGVGIAAVALLTAFIATPSEASEVTPAEPRAAAKELAAADRQMLAQRPFVEAADHLRATAESPALKGFAGIVLTDDAAIDAVKNPGDGSGLVLGVSPSYRATGALGQTLQQRTGVQVRVVAEESLKPVSRLDDWSPWIGEARLWNQPAGAVCTTGFGVRDGQGRPYILTAGHCGQPGQQLADGPASTSGTWARSTPTTTSR